MPLFVELRDRHSSLDYPAHAPGSLGPVIGPFIAVRLLQDEFRVATVEREYSFERVADWLYYGRFYADIEIVPSEGIGPGRLRRMRPFDPLLAKIPAEVETESDSRLPPHF
jgi:hypothetical protein